MSFDEKESFEEIRAGIRKLGEERDEYRDMLERALKMLKGLPNLVSSVGATMCKLSESILPGESVVIIKMTPSTQKCTIHVLGEQEKVTLEDFEYYLANAHRVAQYMANEDGVLEAKHDKAIN